MMGCSETPPLEVYGRGCNAEALPGKEVQDSFTCEPIVYREPPRYPWDGPLVGGPMRITSQHLRCKGSRSHPFQEPEGEKLTGIVDCGGFETHGLPLMGEGQEGVYPVLLELLNYVQERTGRRVVVTCGHRCPVHNAYADRRAFNRASKHMIGAEVDFYVSGLEAQPELIIDLLLEYYRTEPKFAGDSAYQEFQRHQKSNTDVRVPPWFNKEVFIKLYQVDEGRDFDNQHSFPYIGIQVRYDRERESPVVYNSEQAQRYHRW